MSRIFDALQRSESEGAEAENSNFAVATELLEAAEQKLRLSGAAIGRSARDAKSQGQSGSGRNGVGQNRLEATDLGNDGFSQAASSPLDSLYSVSALAGATH